MHPLFQACERYRRPWWRLWVKRLCVECRVQFQGRVCETFRMRFRALLGEWPWEYDA